MPKTGDEISILGYGCMRFPTKGNKIDIEPSTKLVHRAIEMGVNYFDTAYPYHNGQSEPFLAQALGRRLREKVKIATKLPHWSVGTREDMDSILNVQLDRLATDRVDYYLLHALEAGSWSRLYDLGVLDFLEEAKEDGRIVNVGFSFHGDRPAFKTIVDAYDWEFCQIQYNILDEYNQAGREGLEYASRKGLGVVVMEPLRGGNLAGKVPEEIDRIWKRGGSGRTAAEWALRWIWDHPGVTTVLSGMSELDHLEENCRIARDAHPSIMSSDELEIVDLAKEAYRRLMKVGCTGCRYCMPCPSGVDIPGTFEYYNNYHMFDEKRRFRLLYLSMLGGTFGSEPSFASQCTRCGVCLKKCPQHLAIPELLEEAAKDLEGGGGRLMIRVGARLMPIYRWFARLGLKTSR